MVLPDGLGLAFGLAAVVSSVAGQGFLRSPGIVAQASGSATVLIRPLRPFTIEKTYDMVKQGRVSAQVAPRI